MSQAIVENTTLMQMVQALVEALHPEKVVLFGSAARGNAGPDSDIDLFIQVSTGMDVSEASRKGHAALRPLRSILPRGVDLVIWDRAHIERYGQLVGSIVRSVQRDGKVLYEQPAL